MSDTDATKDKPDPAPTPAVADVYQQRSANLRTTATWLITTFGALGAALITSLQLSNLSKATGGRFALGIVGFSLGIGGAVLAISFIAWVLTSAPPGGSKLVDDAVSGDPEGSNVGLLGGFTSIAALGETWQKALIERRAAYTAYLKAFEARVAAEEKGVGGDDLASLKRFEDDCYRRHEIAENEIKLAQPAVQRLLSFADLFELRRRFRRAFKAVVCAVVLAAVGVGLFAGAIAGADDKSADSTAAVAAPVQQPVLGTLDIDDSNQDEFATALGAACDLDQVPVDVLSSDDDTYDLVVLPEQGCEPARLHVPVTEGFVSAGPVALPTTTTTPASRSPKPPLSTP